MSTSSGTPESWISSFCSLLGHEYFAEVSEEFIEDDFNLTGLQNQVAMYKEALEMILDVEPEDDEDEEDEEEEDEEEVSGDGRDGRPRGERRHHSRTASDLSVIESSAELLYGLIHQRFICSRAGIQQMSEKYELGHFGVCPRTNCNQTRTLPVGLSDIPGEDTTVDGAFFGRTFGALFLLTFPEYDLSRSAAEAAANLGRSPDEQVMVNGMYWRNIAPGLGRGKIYEPKIYGFRVSEMSRSGPRMQWLRDKPDDPDVLDEARHFAEAHGTDSDADDEDDDETMNRPAGGRTSSRRRPTPHPRLSQRQRQRQNGSPMTLDANGAESEL
ncbi:93a2c1e4-8604-4254-9c4f-0ececab32ce5 [Thermothielavioides terrestris]|uniref:Casein kinase II subunit beta n=1 Tax=Thermothielavioides terrestris TaxID=2587410 RepID=A0A3S4CBW6_9PEZI|nr:93a2c1e4-8604-4254-9c4f-0ececab32ce5 [Thermothielavioides terrestris]